MSINILEKITKASLIVFEVTDTLEINIKHTDLHFGKEAFTTKDLVVKIAEAKEFYR